MRWLEVYIEVHNTSQLSEEEVRMLEPIPLSKVSDFYSRSTREEKRGGYEDINNDFKSPRKFGK